MVDIPTPADSIAAVVLLGTTDAGKEINLVRRADCSVRMIHYEGMAKLPAQLEGGFSSVSAATHVVASYLAKVKAKEIRLDGSKYPLSKKVK